MIEYMFSGIPANVHYQSYVNSSLKHDPRSGGFYDDAYSSETTAAPSAPLPTPDNPNCGGGRC
jgi:hypothetical protein